MFYERRSEDEARKKETFRPVNARIPPRSYAPSEGYFTGSLRGELDIRKLIFSNVVRFTATGVCTVNPYYVFSLLVSLKQSFLEAKLPLAAPLVGRVMFRARNIPWLNSTIGLSLQLEHPRRKVEVWVWVEYPPNKDRLQNWCILYSNVPHITLTEL